MHVMGYLSFRFRHHPKQATSPGNEPPPLDMLPDAGSLLHLVIVGSGTASLLEVLGPSKLLVGLSRSKILRDSALVSWKN